MRHPQYQANESASPGLQACDLVAMPGRKVWDAVAARNALDAENEARFGALEVDANDILWRSVRGN